MDDYSRFCVYYRATRFPKGLVGTVKGLKNMKRNKKEKAPKLEQNVKNQLYRI